MSVNVQPLEECISTVQITGNEPVTILPLLYRNNENEIKNGNETVNISPSSNDVEFYIPEVQVQVSRSDEEDYYTLLIVKKCSLIQILLSMIYQLSQC